MGAVERANEDRGRRGLLDEPGEMKMKYNDGGGGTRNNNFEYVSCKSDVAHRLRPITTSERVVLVLVESILTGSVSSQKSNRIKQFKGVTLVAY